MTWHQPEPPIIGHFVLDEIEKACKQFARPQEKTLKVAVPHQDQAIPRYRNVRENQRAVSQWKFR